MKEAPKKVEKATKAVAKEVKQAASSVEEFACKFEGVALDRAQTFYDEGIRSVAGLRKLDRKRTPCFERNRSSYNQEIERTLKQRHEK